MEHIILSELRCNGCQQTLPIEHFSRNKYRACGRKWTCKTCDKMYYIPHRAQILAQHKEKYESSPARRKAIDIQSRKWAKDHPERVREISKKYRDKRRALWVADQYVKQDINPDPKAIT